MKPLCPKCGDNFVFVSDGGYDFITWACLACHHYFDEEAESDKRIREWNERWRKERGLVS